jgi:glycosyl hydrolase family 16
MAGGDSATSAAGGRLDRSRYRLEIEDRFDAPDLNRALWLPHYLAHWSSREASAARYEIRDGLRLRIEADQPPWSPEFDGSTRVSSLQTGELGGPVGTPIGQHRFRDGLVVREAQSTTILHAPTSGIVEARFRTTDDAATMAALWMIGVEDRPERSAEICIAEIFGRDVSATETRIGMGLHPFGDPSIEDDFGQEVVAVDARELHAYSAEWTADGVAFFVDDVLVRRSRQSPAYPMQVMLGLYELGDGPEGSSEPASYPKELVVEWFRSWRPAG